MTQLTGDCFQVATNAWLVRVSDQLQITDAGLSIAVRKIPRNRLPPLGGYRYVTQFSEQVDIAEHKTWWLIENVRT